MSANPLPAVGVSKTGFKFGSSYDSPTGSFYASVNGKIHKSISTSP